jgi:hypothetical protein
MALTTLRFPVLPTLILGALAMGVAPAHAQQEEVRALAAEPPPAALRALAAEPPPAAQTPPDTLQAMLNELRARLDSLEAVLAELAEEQDLTTWANRFRARQTGRLRMERAPGAAARDLEALRAAARARVPDPPAADTAQQPSVLRSRNLAALNPEISVTGDVRLTARQPGPQEGNVELREFQFSVQSALDPYSTAKVFFSLEEGEVGLEEAYATWTGLPGAMRMELGRFRQQLGELNRWHLHALPESEYPLVLHEYFGEEGLVGNGIGLYTTVPFHGPGRSVHEIFGQATMGSNEVLFAEGDRPSFLLHLNNFWQINPATYFQLGGTGLWGRNPGEDLESSVYGANARVTWTPPGRGLYRSFTARAEAYGARQAFGGEGERRWGGFLSGTFKTSMRTYLGARVDWVEPLVGPRDPLWAIVPNVTVWQSEWVFLRAEWQHMSLPSLEGTRSRENFFAVQVVWSLGPHKHETY